MEFFAASLANSVPPSLGNSIEVIPGFNGFLDKQPYLANPPETAEQGQALLA